MFKLRYYNIKILIKGEINPKTNRPDSACGKTFHQDDPSECLYHEGYLK